MRKSPATLAVLTFLPRLLFKILMAFINYTFTVQGGSPLQLVVTPVTPQPFVLVGTDPLSLEFKVVNPTNETISLTNVQATVTNAPPGVEITATPESSGIDINPQDETLFHVTVQAVTPLQVGQTVQITITAEQE